MTLEQIVHRVEARLVGLGEALLRPNPRQELREAIADLEALVGLRSRALAEAEADRDATRQRLEENEAAAALLPSQIESSARRGKQSQALRQALELERLRQTVAEDHKALPRLEQTCWSLAFNLRQLERQLARLRDQLGKP
jgi:hypothetical protein